MLRFLANVFRSKKKHSAEYILKYPKGQRYYKDYHNIRNHFIEPNALKVIGRLTQFGYRAFLVGGGVRDLLLGKQPKDYDIVTNATPNEIRKIFANSRIIGRRFKIVHVIFRGNRLIEVSTARSLPENRLKAKNKEELYLKNDNDFGDFREDAARRDFTINSLFFDTRNEAIIDYAGGYEDIQAKMIRTIGEEDISLPEDPVRMLRAVKFSVTLNFELHADLLKGIKKYRKQIQKASKARLHEEMNKIFRTGRTFDTIKKFIETGLFESMFPNLFALALENDDYWEVDFAKTSLGKKLILADKMISEHEDINTTTYLALFADYAIKTDIFAKIGKRKMAHKIEQDLMAIEKEFDISRKQKERIVNIFLHQKSFLLDESEDKQEAKLFKAKDCFLEAFVYYKLEARVRRDDEAIQRALYWELGLRSKMKDAIRKIWFRPLEIQKSDDSRSYSNNNRSYNKPRRNENDNQASSKKNSNNDSSKQRRPRKNNKPKQDIRTTEEQDTQKQNTKKVGKKKQAQRKPRPKKKAKPKPQEKTED